MSKPAAKQQRKGDIPVSEWVVAGVGALLVAVVLVLLIKDATQRDDTPPIVSFTIDSIVNTQAGYVVSITAENTGTQPAIGLVVEAVLAGGGGAAPERREVTIEDLPANSSRRIGLIYQRDPRAHALSLRAVGYH